MWVVRLDLWICELTAPFLQRPEGVLKFPEWRRASIEREITLGRLARGDTRGVVIAVRDERGQRVCSVKASMEIAWHVSRPQGPHPWSA